MLSGYQTIVMKSDFIRYRYYVPKLFLYGWVTLVFHSVTRVICLCQVNNNNNKYNIINNHKIY